MYIQYAISGVCDPNLGVVTVSDIYSKTWKAGKCGIGEGGGMF